MKWKTLDENGIHAFIVHRHLHLSHKYAHDDGVVKLLESDWRKDEKMCTEQQMNDREETKNLYRS